MRAKCSGCECKRHQSPDYVRVDDSIIAWPPRPGPSKSANILFFPARKPGPMKLAKRLAFWKTYHPRRNVGPNTRAAGYYRPWPFPPSHVPRIGDPIRNSETAEALFFITKSTHTTSRNYRKTAPGDPPEKGI